jgi:hypothetical protein
MIIDFKVKMAQDVASRRVALKRVANKFTAEVFQISLTSVRIDNELEDGAQHKEDTGGRCSG